MYARCFSTLIWCGWAYVFTLTNPYTVMPVQEVSGGFLENLGRTDSD
jgi:hypothetical protein